MVPSALVSLDALPLTPNGKVDHRALPAPEDARPATAPVVAPRSELEERLAALWEEVLDVRPVGVHDNFFDLGGHSLLLMRVHERIRDALGMQVSIVDLFARPTIGDLAAFLYDRARDSGPGRISDAGEDPSLVDPSGGEGALSQADERARKQRESLKRKKQAAQAKRNQHGPA
jgi:aryl carrier-like protein